MSRRAADIDAFLRFEIWEDDTPGDGLVCFFDYTGHTAADFTTFDFSATTWTARCIASASAMTSEMTMTWHIEPG